MPTAKPTRLTRVDATPLTSVVAVPTPMPPSVNDTSRPATGDPAALSAADSIVVPPAAPVAEETSRLDGAAGDVNAKRKTTPTPPAPGPVLVVPYKAPSLPWAMPGMTADP